MFGDQQINLANFTLQNGKISSVQNVGEIEQHIFLPNAVCWQLFAWCTKVGEIDPSKELLFKRMVKDLKLTHKWKQNS